MYLCGHCAHNLLQFCAALTSHAHDVLPTKNEVREACIRGLERGVLDSENRPVLS